MTKKLLIILLMPLLLRASERVFEQSAVSQSLFVDRVNPAALVRVSGQSLMFSNAGGRDFSAGLTLPYFQYLADWHSGIRYDRFAVGFPLTGSVSLGAGRDGFSHMDFVGMQLRPVSWLNLGLVSLYEGKNPHVLPGAALRLANDRMTISYQGLIRGSGSGADLAGDLYYLSWEWARGLHIAAQYEAGRDEFLVSAGISLGHLFASGGMHTDTQQSSVRLVFHSDVLRRAAAGYPVFKMTLEGPWQEEYAGPVSGEPNFLDLIESLDRLRHSPENGALLLDIKRFNMGISQLFQLHRALKALKASGRQIFVYSEDGNLALWLLSSVADAIWQSPVGAYNLKGLSSTRFYYRTLLDSLGIRPEISRIAEFKTAPENLMSDRMSDENRTMVQNYLDLIQSLFIRRIGEDLNLSPDSVKSVIAGGPYTQKEAQDAGLITATLYRDELNKAIGDRTGQKRIKIVPLAEYSREKGYRRDWAPDALYPNVAVIYAAGAIMSGKSRTGVLGSETLNARIDAAMKDPFIKAVVLRVDSPGGSAEASDIIRRKLNLLRKGSGRFAAKPLVVSMANYAASGGYYISAEADYIFAEEATLTGSVGIYRTGFSFDKLLKKIRVRPESVVTDSNALYMNPWYRETSREHDFHFRSIDEFYQRFLDVVTGGRHMERAAMDTLAGGRVWSGAEAVSHGMADAIGSLDDAVVKAGDLAHLSPGKIHAAYYYPSPAYRNSGFGLTEMENRLVRHLTGISALPAEYWYPEGSVLYYCPVSVDDITE